MSNIDEETKLPLKWAVTIILTVVGVAFNAGVAHFRLQQLETEWVKFEAREEEHRKLDEAHELKLQSLDINMQNISTKLDAIDDKLGKIQERIDRGR